MSKQKRKKADGWYVWWPNGDCYRAPTERTARIEANEIARTHDPECRAVYLREVLPTKRRKS